VIAFPLAASIISAAFGVHLLVRFGRRGQLFEGLWGLAMLMYAIASGALLLGILGEWSSAEFRAYWLFGAVLNVPYLAVGEAYLLLRQRWIAHALLVLVLAATAWAASEVRTAPLDASVLREDFFSGRDVLGEDSTSLLLARIYSFAGYGGLALGALWSAFQMRGRPDLRSRFYGTLLVVLGATVVAAGAAFAAAANFAGFSVTLAAGVAVMYWGFLTATQRRPAPAPSGTRTHP
jgi:MFS family permease